MRRPLALEYPGTDAVPAPPAPRVVGAPGEPDDWQTSPAEHRAGQAVALGDDIVVTHVLPSRAEVAVDQSQPLAFLQLAEYAHEVSGSKGDVALEDALISPGEQHPLEYGGQAPPATARPPDREGQVLLPRFGLLEMPLQRHGNLGRHRHRELVRHRRTVARDHNSANTVQICTSIAGGVAGTRRMRLRYCHSDPNGLAWLDAVPMATAKGRT